jgi:hypothetical protein
MKLPPLFSRLAGNRRPMRGIVIVLAALLLHLIAVGWARKYVGMPASLQPEPAAITVTMQTPPAPPPKPEPAVVKPAPKPRPKPPAPHPPESAPPPAAAQQAPPVIAGDQGDWRIGAPGTGTEAGAAAAAVDSPSAAAPPPPPHQTDAPPSAELKYDVHGLREGQNVYGSGKISWQNLGGRYRIDGSAGILFFTILEFRSEGVLDDFGVSPTLYTEKRFRKTATDTRFEHERNTITFSTSDNRYPRPGDAQDRASVIWQLAAIGRSNPDAFSAGATFELFVAGVRDAEPWRITVRGDENVDIGGDPTQAWHLVRLPQPGSYDQKIDIWLAPQRQWYPVRIRYTESNGEFLDMSLSNVRSPSPQ